MTWTGWVTFVLGALGSALGLFNTWQGWSDRRVCLRVKPTYARPFDQGGRVMDLHCLSVEVQNEGAYAVTIAEIGLLVGEPKGDLPARRPFPPSAVIIGPALPHRLDWHDAVTLTVPIHELPAADYSSAYVRTAAGRIVSGNSPALKDIVSIIRNATSGRR